MIKKQATTLLYKMTSYLGKFKRAMQDGSKRRLFENFLSLSFLQGANFILPLLTLPFLVRMLGVEKYGLVMFAFAFNQYFIILTDFGFNLSATREISVNRDNPSKIIEIFWSVLFIKTVFLCLGFLILLGIIYFFNKFRSDYLLYILSYGISVGQTYFPVWFFQGIEKMKFVTVLNVIAKLIFTLSIFVIIRQPDDFIYVPLVNSLGFIIASIISIYLVLKKFHIKFAVPSLSSIVSRFKDSSHFFVSRAAVAFYTNSNVVIINLILGNTAAGYYSAAEKLYQAMMALYVPLNDSLYPFMAKYKDVKTYKKIFFGVTVFNLILCLFIFLFSYHIISFIYGSGFEISASLLQLFAVLACISIPAILLGYPFLATMGYPGYANYSVVIAALVHISMLVAFIPILNLKLVVVLLIITQLVVIFIRIIGVKSKLNSVWKG